MRVGSEFYLITHLKLEFLNSECQVYQERLFATMKKKEKKTLTDKAFCCFFSSSDDVETVKYFKNKFV